MENLALVIVYISASLSWRKRKLYFKPPRRNVDVDILSILLVVYTQKNKIEREEKILSNAY